MSINHKNLIWAGGFGFAGAALGSAVSILLIGTVLWITVSALFNHYSPKHSVTTLRFAMASAFYGGTILLFSAAHGAQDWGRLLGLAVFFFPLILGPRLNLSKSNELLQNLLIGAALGAIVLLPYTLFEYFVLDERSSGLAGNPGILAVVSLTFGGIGSLNLARKEFWFRVLGIVALCATSMNVIATEMRGAWLTLPLVVAIVFWSAAPTVSKVSRLLVVGLWAIVFSGFVALDAQKIVDRMGGLVSNWERMVERESYTSSLGRRIIMYSASKDAILAAPFAGYGLEGRMEAVNEHVAKELYDYEIWYSHPHNGFLAALLDAGILGLLALLTMIFAPIFLVLRKQVRSDWWHIQFAGILVLTVAYCSSGLTNILFQHDIMDSVFVGTATIILAGFSEEQA